MMIKSKMKKMGNNNNIASYRKAFTIVYHFSEWLFCPSLPKGLRCPTAGG
jgi:hypothetical protein